ncbi:xanthine dehydrogenase family protein molybdopterin-binding subunit [uncultured Spirosoma sp.]|uniref:xanthine dehydrogenase family protein molybdopterin-binding subunit n=1 Tax=uncultured Spirosoma sp. TaxID=278208 RepID=UPI0025845A47|nr:xanthine dehydrogenase family protein molybdopterin-binding subunit [uncultured Spirosoma sp.]
MEPKLIGDPVDRIDGKQKVTGGAHYAGDIKQPEMAYAVLVMSTIANGTIRDIDTADAEKLPGVLAIMTHKNTPRLPGYDANKPGATALGRVLHLLHDDRVDYSNQPIAMAIADSFEHAVDAANHVRVTYQAKTPAPGLPTSKAEPFRPQKLPRPDDPVDTQRGDLNKAMAAAEVSLKQTYHTPTQVHNALEPHTSVAIWEGKQLTIYQATQGIFPSRERIAEYFALPPENVRVIAQFVGGGFGSKGPVWADGVLAAMAAQYVKRPVKLELRRSDMFGMVGSRSATSQQLDIGASRSGDFLGMAHRSLNQTSVFDDFSEPAGILTRVLYKCPNQEVTHRSIRANIGSPSPMRAPGEAPGMFALESAIDELAYQLNMDPIALRLKNYAETDQQKELPFSSKSLRECYQQAADRFGWSKRSAAPRSMRDGNILIGMGMASAIYPTIRDEASAKIKLNADGTVLLSIGTQDIGTGSYTAMTQLAADAFGISPDRVTLRAGDTRQPKTPVSGGSRTTASAGSAVVQAAEAVILKAKQLALNDLKSPLNGQKESDMAVEKGRLFLKSDPKKGEALTALLKRNGGNALEASTSSKSGEEKEKYSMYAHGAQFAEVRIDEALGEIRVSKLTGAYAAGRIVNAKTAHSQLVGGIVWGVSMALLEHAIHDPRTNRIMNANLAEYHVPVNADIPDIDAFFIDEKDEIVNPAGVKGIGEIGITGSVAAIANAIYHATGKRIRELPITPDKILSFTA